jgi:chemotaxis protein methyltransferase CheR
VKLTLSERQLVTEYIYGISAIALDASKDYLIEGRLAPLAKELGCGSLGELVHKAKVDAAGALKRRIIDAITTNETLFFRDQAPFELLRHKLIPELIDRQKSHPMKPAIRIWSAACSTGQELYSVAMVLREVLGDPARYNIRLLGTDLSDQVVARASAAIYNAIEMSRGLTEAQRQKHFLPAAGGWKLRDEVRAMATFRRANLMEDFSALGKFDIIFCRNVAIYFKKKDREQLFRRLIQSLDAHGILIIGSMESLEQNYPQLEFKRHLRTTYYQLKA